jgi:hypothetical protein
MNSLGWNDIISTVMSAYEAKIFAGKICKTTSHPRPFPQLFYFPGVTSKPWHNPAEFNFTKYLQSRYEDIKEEYLKKQD